MIVGLILLGLLVIAAVAGVTGKGVADSRDPDYGLSLWTLRRKGQSYSSTHE